MNLSIGVHDIHLRVQDEKGTWSEEVVGSLIIHEKPNVSIERISPFTPIDHMAIWFTGNASDDRPIERYVWKVDGEVLYDGNRSEFESSNLSAREYMISLMVQDQFGVWSTDARLAIVVYEYPIAVIEEVSPNPALSSDTLTFTARMIEPMPSEVYIWSTKYQSIVYGHGPCVHFFEFTGGIIPGLSDRSGY